jgi:hypothetical protein
MMDLVPCKLFEWIQMSARFPALLTFAKRDPKDEHNTSIYKYLADAGFEPEDVKNWGRLGSLVDALKEVEEDTCTGPILGEQFLEFVAQLPPGNTPRPQIRHRLQRAPAV